jgi:hypothetical protein
VGTAEVILQASSFFPLAGNALPKDRYVGRPTEADASSRHQNSDEIYGDGDRGYAAGYAKVVRMGATEESR